LIVDGTENNLWIVEKWWAFSTFYFLVLAFHYTMIQECIGKLVVGMILCALASLSNTPPKLSKEEKGDRSMEPGFDKQMNVFRLWLVATHILFLSNMVFAWMGSSFAQCERLSLGDLFLLFSAVSGYFLRLHCFNTLGRLFTFGVKIREKHVLVTSGPYGRVRHPSYTGQTMVLCSWCRYFLQAYWWILAALYFAYLYFRVRREEEALRTHFGPEYDVYVKKVPYRFVPHVF